MHPPIRFFDQCCIWMSLPALVLVTGCDIETPGRGTAVPSGVMTQVCSADGRGVSIGEGSGAMTISASGAAQDPARCTPDGKYLDGNTIVLDFAEQTVKQEIEQTRRTLDDVTSRIEQCRGKSKGLPEYDAQFGCDRARFRQLQGRSLQLSAPLADARSLAPQEWADMNEVGRRGQIAARRVREASNRIERTLAELEFAQLEVDWAKASKAMYAVVDAKENARKTELGSVKAQLDQMTPLCERAETAYEQNPCNTARLASDAFTRNRAQQQLAALEARRDLIKDCRKDRERQAGGPSGMGSPTAEQLLLQTLPGIMGGFGPHRKPSHPPPKQDKSREPHWDGHKH